MKRNFKKSLFNTNFYLSLALDVLKRAKEYLEEENYIRSIKLVPARVGFNIIFL